ncbi:hypothetical protein [Persicirhabdus sediminis]|nr:hypothetical protein [Persicirhabdus sediminis]
MMKKPLVIKSNFVYELGQFECWTRLIDGTEGEFALTIYTKPIYV